MKINEFESQIERLKNVYSEKSYPMERTKAIWNEVRMLDLVDFEQVVTELIGTSSYAPMLDKFRTAKQDVLNRNAAERAYRLQNWLASRPECWMCGKSGHVTARKLENNSEYLFRCSCEFGEKLFSRKIPCWNFQLELEFIPKFFNEEKKAVKKEINFNPEKLVQNSLKTFGSEEEYFL